MPLSMIVVEGYRSVRRLWTRLDGLNLVLGPNGSGKTNLHRALSLIESGVAGTLARAVAEEGGMPSVAWAGERRAKDPVRVYVEVRFHDYTYALELGLVTHPGKTIFYRDPEVKSERISLSEGRRPVV
ncbi:MAG TPA: hypothetical protein VFO85_08945, partial [Vicinamibacteria bacterium]|nr:hypothetical protein [Vicinamibacteria bacterium]